MRVIAHIDMDAFYASVEQLDRPELRGKPVIVGGDPFKGRGVVSAASYEARKYGVRSAMPIKKAYRLCPHAVFLRPRFQRYEQISRQIREILLRFSPLVEFASIDEAYVDLTGTQRLFGDPVETARRIKRTIKKETGLTASVGVAPNKMLAKIASDFGKPDGFVVVPPERVREFLDPLPVSALPGVGKKFEEKLLRIGIRRVGDVLRFPRELFVRLFGKAGDALFSLALGEDQSPVVPERERKSISVERTFEVDIADAHTLRRRLLLLCDKLAERLLAEGLVGRTVTLKVKYADFRLVTRSETLSSPTRSAKRIFETAAKLFERTTPAPIRLLGVGLSNLSPSQKNPPELFSDSDEVDEKLLEALAKIREKYGDDGIVRAFVLEGGKGREK